MHGTMNLKKKNTTEVQYKTGNILIAYPLLHVRATIVAVECVFVALGINHAMRMCCISIGGLSGSTTYRSFATRVSQLKI